MQIMSRSVALAGSEWGRDSTAARGRQPARSQVDNPAEGGPDCKGHRVTFPAGLLYSVSDPDRSVIQPADRRQQVRVVGCG
jgi:hypothetical protein